MVCFVDLYANTSFKIIPPRQSRAISQDSNVYPDPHLFIPERFIGENNLPDSRDIVFGYGRRACPGRQFADSNIWLAIASMTATLHIAKALDEDGGEITPPYEYTNGIVG